MHKQTNKNTPTPIMMGVMFVFLAGATGDAAEDEAYTGGGAD